ncbi:hypothetical protein HGRIS_000240 [Hohenbuehelia grisea]|uniref:Uncharacterized protein n=1 Tax=Hohenbuehelia grisea TaxID=104357 RepID=A0ABR3JQL8_9AGAR
MDVPPLRQRKGCEGPVWIPISVCGFLYSFDDFAACAKKHFNDDFDLTAKAKERTEYQMRDYRCQDAQKYIGRVLDDPHIFLVKLADGTRAQCVVIGSNDGEEEMANAQDPVLIAKFPKALDITCAPKWYRIAIP